MSMGVTACLLLGTTPTPMLTKAAVTETANHIANKSKESEKTETKKSKESEAVNTEKTKETEIPGAKKEKESETVKSEKSKETEIKKAKELNKDYKNIIDALLEEMFNKDNYKK